MTTDCSIPAPADGVSTAGTISNVEYAATSEYAKAARSANPLIKDGAMVELINVAFTGENWKKSTKEEEEE